MSINGISGASASGMSVQTSRSSAAPSFDNNSLGFASHMMPQVAGGPLGMTAAGPRVGNSITPSSVNSVLMNSETPVGEDLSVRDVPVELVKLPVKTSVDAQQSTSADFSMQLPNSAEVGSKVEESVEVYDGSGTAHALTVTATKKADATDDAGSVWEISVTDGEGGETIEPSPLEVAFNKDGTVNKNSTPATDFSIKLSDGTEIAASFSSLTSYDNDYIGKLSADGNAAATYEDFTAEGFADAMLQNVPAPATSVDYTGNSDLNDASANPVLMDQAQSSNGAGMRSGRGESAISDILARLSLGR